MNIPHFPKSLAIVFAAAALVVAVPIARVVAQSETDAKIRLMSEALRARDAGDIPAAQKALAELAKIAPNHQKVEKLRAEIEAQASARRSARAQQAEAQRAAEAAAIETAARREAEAKALA